MQWKDSRRKYDIYNNIVIKLLKKNCEVEKLMKFLKDIELFEVIQKDHKKDFSEVKWLTMSAIIKTASYNLS